MVEAVGKAPGDTDAPGGQAGGRAAIRTYLCSAEHMRTLERKILAIGLVVLVVLTAILVNVASNRSRDEGNSAAKDAQRPTTAVASAPAQSPRFQPTNPPVVATPPTNAGAPDAFELHRTALLQGRYGTNRIEDLLKALVETPGGPEIQLIFQALALRKDEALPILKARLKTGEMWEKHMLTKFLRLCPWLETRDELLALAQSDTEHWLPRQGAVFALGALGDPIVGQAVAAILNSPRATLNLQMAAVSTLSRIQFADAATAIMPFAQAENIHLRLFAMRALVELGESVDEAFLLSCLRNEDYVVRQEASDTLWRIGGQNVAEALRAMAKEDFNEAVRDAASQALLRRELAGRNPAEQVEILRKALDSTERLTALWILRTALDEGGIDGRRLVETVAARDDFLGERSRAYLILADSRTR